MNCVPKSREKIISFARSWNDDTFKMSLFSHFNDIKCTTEYVSEQIRNYTFRQVAFALQLVSSVRSLSNDDLFFTYCACTVTLVQSSCCLFILIGIIQM